MVGYTLSVTNVLGEYNYNKSNNNNNTDIYTQRRIEQSYINVLHAGGGH